MLRFLQHFARMLIFNDNLNIVTCHLATVNFPSNSLSCWWGVKPSTKSVQKTQKTSERLNNTAPTSEAKGEKNKYNLHHIDKVRLLKPP